MNEGNAGHAVESSPAERLHRDRVATAMEVLAIIHTRDRASVPASLKTLHDTAVTTLIKALENTHGE